MPDALKFEKTGEGRYDIASIAFAGETYYMVKSDESGKWTVTNGDGQELGTYLTFADAKKLIRDKESEGQIVQLSSEDKPAKEDWTVTLENGETYKFKSAGEKQAKYRAYRIGRGKGSKVNALGRLEEPS